MARSKQLLIIAHSIQPPGGGNGVGAWILQALRRDYRLTLLSWDECDLALVNRHYGTSLETDDFRLLRVPKRLRWVEAVPGSFSLVKYHLLMRFARGIAAHYEGVVSTCNEMDLGMPGIQYVHYPWGWLPRPEHSEEEYRRMRGRIHAYYSACRALSGFRSEVMGDNLSLCNSAYIADKMERLYGSPVRVLHPPAPGEFAPVPWARRRNTFAAVGRIAPEKNLPRSIAILEQVRTRGHAVSLEIIGTPDDPGHLEEIRAMVETRSDWISLSLDLPRSQLTRRLGQVRYGIHAMREEHYGMVVAEMLQAGCIPFVPDNGGQVEIVGDAPLLRYSSDEDAVEKISQVIGDPGCQAEVLAHLQKRRVQCSTDAFVEGLRDAVAEFYREW